MNVEATLVTFRFTDDNHETLESITINLKDLFAEYGYIPRTEAIPIEFIEEYIKYQDTEEQKVLRMMWNAWELVEKENDKDSE